jgi:dTDP-4-amino-4,6-dideoxygalactose transaminase
VGNFGEFGCFSLHPAKNLHDLGDGGFIITNKRDYYEKLIKIRNHGHTSRELIDSFGINSRLDSIQAAYANIMIEDYYIWQKKINQIAKLYNEKITNKLIKPIVKPNTNHVYHNYILTTKFRDQLKNYLKKNGIETRIHYPIAIHNQKIFIKTFGKIKLPNTEKLSKEIISLPIYPELDIKKVKFIIKMINQFFNYKLKNNVN